ncbi:DUF2410 domain containing protein [Naviculisporaceae sp. PSN 640]
MNTSAFAALNGVARGQHTPTAMGRWSVLDKQPPAVNTIKAIHVYDFDNTLFKTPLPNRKIWSNPTLGMLANPDCFANGGWWHDSRILAATGEGLEKEEPRAWNGWWNEKIVELIELSNQQKDALCVLLTGRSESGFSELIKRMVASKKLEFDLIALKPAVGPDNQRFGSTMLFKQAFLETLMETYKYAEEIRIYEDRPRHVKAFRDFMADYNRKQNGIGGAIPTRGPIAAEVIQVAESATSLDPEAEVAEVLNIINDHNSSLHKRKRGTRGERLAIKKSVSYTGYLINSADQQRLLTLTNIPQNSPEAELKYHANNILICARPCTAHILEKVGGMGAKMKWEVTGTGCHENSIWAACVKPVPSSAKFHTDNPSPYVVLALRKDARPVDAGKIQNWQPVPPDKSFIFETTVGEKVLLHIKGENSTDDAYEGQFQNKSSKKQHTGEDNFRSRAGNTYNPGSHQQRNFHQSSQPGRGGGGHQNKFRGGSAGRGRGQRGGISKGGRGGRGGGHGHHYKSLDDMGAKDSQAMSYEDDSHRSFNPPTGPANPGFQYQAAQYGGWQQQPSYGGQNRPMGGGGYGAGGGGGGGPELNNYY